MFIRNWIKACLGITVVILCVQVTQAAQTKNIEEYTFKASKGTYVAVPLAELHAKRFVAYDGDGNVTFPGLTDVQSGKAFFAHINNNAKDISKGHQIGFNFQYCGEDFTTFNISSYGHIILGNLGDGKKYASLDNDNPRPESKTNTLAPLYDYLNTFCVYQLSGTAGSRVMTIEYFRVSWLLGASGFNRSFQIKLYEGSNKIEYIYNIADAPGKQFATQVIGASIKLVDAQQRFISVTPGATPSTSTTVSNDFIDSNEFLKSGVTYTFTPTDVAAVQPPIVAATAATKRTKTSFQANWGETSDTQGYKLYVATDEAFTTPVSDYNPKVLGKVNLEEITGLTENTTYYYRVVATNGNLESAEASNTIAVLTLDTGALGAVESFDTGVVPSTWTVLNENKGFTWSAQNNSGVGTDFPTDNDGHYVSCLSDHAANGANNDWLISPVFTIHSTLGATLTYKVFHAPKKLASNKPYSHKVMVSEVGSDDWTEVYSENRASFDTVFREVSVDIESYKGKDIQIAFVYDSFRGTGISIDDILVATKTSLITLDQTVYEPGKPITVTFNNPASASSDRIAVYSKDNVQQSPAQGTPLSFEDVGSRITGTVALSAPTTPGEYRVLYVKAGGNVFEPQNSLKVVVAPKVVLIPDPVVATAATLRTKTTFNANWNTPSSVDIKADGYKLYVSTVATCDKDFVGGYDPKQLGKSTTEVTSEVVADLTENTTYYYKVVAFNDKGDAADSKIIMVLTLSTGELGKTETFTTGIPTTWTVENRDKDNAGGTHTWVAQTNDGTNPNYPTNNDGNYVSCVSAVGAEGNDWLITPAFSVDSTQGATLSYKVCNGYETTLPDTTRFQHRVMISVVGTADWEVLLTDKQVNPTTGFREVFQYIDKAKFLGKEIQLAFVYNSKNGLVLSIDDVLVSTTSLITTRNKVLFESGKMMQVNFKNSNSAVSDRIAVFKKGNALLSPAKNGYIDLKYLNDTAKKPTKAVLVGTVSLQAPNYPGQYRLVYLTGDDNTFDPATAIDIDVSPQAVVTKAAGVLPGRTSFTAVWNATTGATSYKLYVSTDAACKDNFLSGYAPAEVPADVTQKDVRGVVDTQTYYYKVVAFSGLVATPDSNITKVEPEVITPVYGVSTKIDGHTLSWSVDFEDNIVSYRIEKEVNGKWVVVTTVAATSEARDKYQVEIADSHANYRVVSVDGNGLTQAFGVHNDSSLFVSLKAGWNLISVPVNNADLSGIAGTVWGWNGEKYVTVETAEAMQGLWVYAATAKELTISGTAATSATLLLKKGWNLAGPVHNCTAPTGFSIYTWDSTYSQILEDGGLIRGTGYWFFSDSAQTLELK